MIIIMDTSVELVQRVIEKLTYYGLHTHVINNSRTIITVEGDTAEDYVDGISRMTGVQRVIPIATPFKLVSRTFKNNNTEVNIKGIIFGGSSIPVIAGPCAVENYDILLAIARAVKTAGAVMLRGGAYKPRTSPYSFQGLEIKGLEILKKVSEETGMPIVTEVVDQRSVEIVADYTDMIQIGARNMQNYALLKEISKINKPVLLKRGIAATVEEWLMAAEYLMLGGNEQIVLCERGIRTFEKYTRNTLDLNAVALAKELSHLPVIVDPSHGTGDWRLVSPMARASLGAGADGLIIEVHNCPEEAVSDGIQSLTPANFTELMESLKPLADALGRKLTLY